jgi:hypothetical protein
MDTVQKFEQVLTANVIYLFGYPASIGLQQAPQIDYNAPLLRRGIISGVNSSKSDDCFGCYDISQQQRRPGIGGHS